MSAPRINPAVVLLAAPAGPTDLLRTAAADAVVLAGSDAAWRAASVAGVRPDLPLVVVADTDEAGVIELLATADEVVGSQATVPEVARAVQQAIARRAHLTSPVPPGPREPVSGPALPQELRAIGRLAAGLGHEFNNLLLVIDGNADLLRERVAKDDQLEGAAEAIADACRRAATLTRQLLAFGRQQTLIPVPVDLNTVVGETAPALRRAMGRQTRLVTELQNELPRVRVDAPQLSEALSNLAAIASEAMPSGGTFTIQTDTCTIEDRDRVGRPWLRPGYYVRLRVGDTGRGFEERTLPHLFEPFFVPEGVSRGGSLVLSSVYGIVKQSGGFIWAESRMNQGTLVTILLPPMAALETSAAPGVRAEPTRGTTRVLLVEDLDSVRDVLANLLEMRDFEVLSAGSAEEAIEIARTRPFDVLLTDVSLPGRSGPELARQIRRAFPGTPVLFMSGHPANAMDPRDLEDPRGFLQKPFSANTLVHRLHELLGRN